MPVNVQRKKVDIIPFRPRPGLARPASGKENPFRPFPVSPVTAAGIDLPGAGVLPGQVMPGIVRGKLLVPSQPLPVPGLRRCPDGGDLPRQLLLGLQGEFVFGHIPPGTAKPARTDRAGFA